jgi:DNA invertase Pin-like site-specific DNA recombinase
MAKQTKRAKPLTPTIVRQIRDAGAEGTPGREIAAAFNIHETTVSGILTGKIYTKAGGPTRKPRNKGGSRKGSHKSSRKVADDMVIAIREAYVEGGRTIKSLAESCGLGKTTVSRIVNRVTYTDVGGPTPQANPTKKEAPQRNRQRDLTELPTNEVIRLLQALSHEWPKIQEAFKLLDSIISGDNE